MRSLFILLVLKALFSISFGWRFRLDRHFNGFLGAPFTLIRELPEAQWFTQILDHFTPVDVRTWKQRYFVNDTFFNYEHPGPVFLMIGGEGGVDPRWMVAGAWIEYAQRFKALCINLEHRFYGKSYPTKDASKKNLQYLSSQQALADTANFITAMNEKHKFNENVKWIAFGGSYPGSLAAWMRLKYPHLIHAVVSSSGPLVAKLNFSEYFQLVVRSLTVKSGGQECVDSIKMAHKQVVWILNSQPDILMEKFRLCKSIRRASSKDIITFYNALADNFGNLVQYNEDNRIGVREEYRNVTINTVCDILTDPGSNLEYNRLALFNSIMLDMYNQSCLDYDYNKMIQNLRNDSLLSNYVRFGARQWIYQTCTEFGFYQTTTGESEVFGNMVDIDYFIQQCQDIYGNRFNRKFIENAITNTNTAYGGLNISAERVIYVHGSLDPWHYLSITKSKDSRSPVVYINGAAHCANMYPSMEEDSVMLKDARLLITQYIDLWLNSTTVPYIDLYQI